MKKEKLKSLSILDNLEWIPYLVECKQLKQFDVYEIQTKMGKQDFVYISEMAKTLHCLRIRNYTTDYPMEDMIMLLNNSNRYLQQLTIDGVDDINLLMLMVVISCPNLKVLTCHTSTEVSKFHTHIIDLIFNKIETLRLVKLTFRQEEASPYPTFIKDDLIKIVKKKDLSFILHQDDDKFVISVGLQRLKITL